MRARFIDDGYAFRPFTPVFRKPSTARLADAASTIRVRAARAINPAMLIEAFGMGWLCGFAAGAGAVAIFLRH